MEEWDVRYESPPVIEDRKLAEEIAGRSIALAETLQAAAEKASRMVGGFVRLGNLTPLVLGLDELKLAALEAVAEIDRIKRSVGASNASEKKRGRGWSWAEQQEREWARWGGETHEPSLAEPKKPHFETSAGDGTIVHLRGKRIGYVQVISTSPEGAPRGTDERVDGFYVLDPFKRAYPKPTHYSFEDAVDRLVDESRAFMEEPGETTPGSEPSDNFARVFRAMKGTVDPDVDFGT